MSQKLDPDLLQRYLSLRTIPIKTSIKKYLNLPTFPGSILLLEPSLENIQPEPMPTLLDGQESSITRHAEHQILSLNPIASADSAKELFANNDTKSSVNFKYSIHNSIMIDIFDDMYYFNIDEANNSAAAHGKFFINKFSLVNRSKDSFTAKSNYVLTLNIAFKYFDDLLEENVVVRSYADPSKTLKIPLIKILYKYFDARTDVSNDVKNIKDGTGLYFNQVLKLDSGRFPTTVNELGETINRTLHMTFYKHQLNVFQNQEPLIYDYENELIVEYISYEADITEKVLVSQNTVSTINNLYELLTDSEVNALKEIYVNDQTLTTFSYANKVIQDTKKSLEGYRTALACNDLASASGASADLTAYKLDADKKKTYEKQITELVSNIGAYKANLDQTLIKYILYKCTKYKINVKYDALGYQKVDEDSASIGWSGGLAIAGLIAGGILLTVATGGIGTVAAGSALATGLSVAGNLAVSTSAMPAISSIINYFSSNSGNSYKINNKAMIAGAGETVKVELLVDSEQKAQKEIKRRREYLEQIKKEQDFSGTGYFYPIARAGAATGEFLSGLTGGMTVEKKIEIINREIEALTSGTSDINDDTDNIDIQFILYGDLIKLIKPPTNEIEKIIIVCGGKLIPQDSTGTTNSYINFAHMPISLTKLYNFLQDRIAKKENRRSQYSSEEFLRDTHDILLKGAMRSADAVLDAKYKSYIPGNMYMNSSVHVVGDDFTAIRNTPSVNLLSPEDVAQFKKKLIKSKNILNRTDRNKNLAKIYTIGTSEEMRYYDYYEGYKEWALKNDKQRSNFASLEFQQYILEEHLTPCVLIRYTANEESILKRKNVQFTRIDNQNLTTGNIINGSPIFRLPYQFTSEFKPYIAFFMDIGSLIFISPPQSRSEFNINTFGFGGLYLIKESRLEYTFQRLEGGAPTLPNEDSKLILGGTMLTHGDAIKPKQVVSAAEREKAKCQDAMTALNPAPAAKAP